MKIKNDTITLANAVGNDVDSITVSKNTPHINPGDFLAIGYEDYGELVRILKITSPNSFKVTRGWYKTVALEWDKGTKVTIIRNLMMHAVIGMIERT